jgi:predicted RNase H-like HicB family nuclease
MARKATRTRKPSGGVSQRIHTRTRSRFTAVIERDVETGLLVGYVLGFAGAHSQAATLDELTSNLREVIEMLLEDGEPRLEAEFVGTQQIG